jgi:hypothetical protein
LKKPPRTNGSSIGVRSPYSHGRKMTLPLPGAVFSDAANKALQRGLKEFIKEDWRKVFDPDNVKDQIESIT